MQQFQVQAGRPIYSMQEFLRVIAMSDGKLPVLIPDGIYGTQTEATVRIFQTEYGLPATGEVDNDTWDRIIEVYTDVRVYAEPPHSTQMFPASDYVIREGENGDFMYPIQAMLQAISSRFSNIPDFELTGTHSGDALNATQEIQKHMDTDCNGEIDVRCWHRISRLYENLVSKDIFSMRQPDGALGGQSNQMPENQVSKPSEPADQQMRAGREEAASNNNTVEIPDGMGLSLTPKLDVYDADNPKQAEETPLPRRGGTMRGPNVQPTQPESVILRSNMSLETDRTAPNGMGDSEMLNSTDMQGNPIPRNPSPTADSVQLQEEGAERQEVSLQDAPIRLVETLSDEEREELGVDIGTSERRQIGPENTAFSSQEQQAAERIAPTNNRPEQNQTTKKEPLKWDFF